MQASKNHRNRHTSEIEGKPENEKVHDENSYTYVFWLSIGKWKHNKQKRARRQNEKYINRLKCELKKMIREK